MRLHDVRLDTVADTLKSFDATRVLGRLVKDRQFTEIVGVEVGSVSWRAPRALWRAAVQAARSRSSC